MGIERERKKEGRKEEGVSVDASNAGSEFASETPHTGDQLLVPLSFLPAPLTPHK